MSAQALRNLESLPLKGPHFHDELGKLDDRGGVVIPFEPRSIPTASSSGAVSDKFTRLGQPDPVRANPSTDEVARGALATWSAALKALPYTSVADANELTRTNMRGVRVHLDALENSWPDAVGVWNLTMATKVSVPFGNSEATNAWWNALATPPVNVDLVANHRRAIAKAKVSEEQLFADFRKQLDAASAVRAQQDPRTVVMELAQDHGIGQLLTARSVGVSPTAVRKWRRGE